MADRLAQPDAANGGILDGYPRNKAQADFLSEHLASKGESVTTVLLLELDLYVAFKRAFGRVTSKAGDSYNIYYMKDGLDVSFEDHPEGAYPARVTATLAATGEVLNRRPDDANAAAVIKRIDTYLETTQPLIDYYSDKGLLARINADQPVEAVGADIQAAVDGAK